jgi:S-layer homology domain
MNPASTGRFSVVGAICGVMALLVSLGGVAFGGGADLFSDISASPFREEINRIGRAGCASGFPDGTFQPQNSVNRQQFAFWTNNCAGRMAYESTGTQSVPIANLGQPQTITTVGITGGATDSGVSDGGFVLLVGTVTFRTNDTAGAPYSVEAWIEAPATMAQSGRRVAQLSGINDDSGLSQTSIAVNAMFPIGPEENQTFQLRVRYADQTEHTINVLGDLWASYVPFGADGDRATNTFEG